MKVVIVGAGPSGLATLKYLLSVPKFFDTEPIEVICVEKTGNYGGAFTNLTYEDVELVSSKYLTAFSDFRFPAECPDFPTARDVVDYFRRYVHHHSLEDFILVNTEVLSIRRRGNGHAVTVRTANGPVETVECDAVAICSGMHNIPNIPEVEGIELAKKKFHSSAYSGRADFSGGNHITILGAGETAFDLAYQAVTSDAKSVTLCHSDGFFCGPKAVVSPIVLGDIFGEPANPPPNKPVDCCTASLFDTAYVPPILQKNPLLWGYYNLWIKFTQTFISGTPRGPDQWVGRPPKARDHVDAIFFNKSQRAIPYIAKEWRSDALWNRIRAFFVRLPHRPTGDKVIAVAPWPKRITDEGFLEFRDNGSPEYERIKDKKIPADIVVFATGYKRVVKFLDAAYPQPGDVDVRGIYHHDDVTVAFIGFMRPSLGAIPPLAELQAQLWILRLLQSKNPSLVPRSAAPGPSPFPSSIPAYELDYSLHARNGRNFAQLKGGVDHEAYAYQLALDIGAAPKLGYVLSWGPSFFRTWAMGPNFNTKFRLVGPWKDEKVALCIMKTELKKVVRRWPGLFFFTTYTVIPMIIFGILSILICATIWIKDRCMTLANYCCAPFNRVAARGTKEDAKEDAKED